MGPLVVLQSQEVVVAFLAHQTAEHTCFMGLLVVQQGTRVPVSSPTLVTLVRLITLVNHGPTSIAANVSAASRDPAADAVSPGHPFSSIQALLAQRATPVLTGAQVRDKVVAISKEHPTINTDVTATIHFISAVG